jgi:hypothetical protein
VKKIGLVLALALAACASGEPSPAPPPTAPASAPAPPPPPPALPRPAPVPTPPPDQCGAYELQNLVGKPRTSIPVPVDPSKRRVVCSSCPMTMDFNPQRLTITYDSATGLVTKVQCG